MPVTQTEIQAFTDYAQARVSNGGVNSMPQLFRDWLGSYDPSQFCRRGQRALARQINEQARNDPDSPYAGKFVGIANGQVVIVGDAWPEVVATVRRAEPDPARCRCIEASADYESVVQIWSAA